MAIQNDQSKEIKEITTKIIKHWKNKVFATEKKSLMKKSDNEEISSKTSTNIEISQSLDLNENSLEEDKVIYFKERIKKEERDPTRRNTKILIYDGFFKSVFLKNSQELNKFPQKIFDFTIEIESKLYQTNFVSSDKKDKYLKQTKAIVLNLYNNLEFVKEIIEGNLTAEKLSIMDPSEMASEDTKNKRQKLKKEAFNARRSDWNLLHASTRPGIYRCGKCKSNRTTYYQAQIRRADEPMTTFITCLECTHSWKQ